MQPTLFICINDNVSFSYKLEDVPETDIAPSNKELDTKYNIVLLL